MCYVTKQLPLFLLLSFLNLGCDKDVPTQLDDFELKETIPLEIADFLECNGFDIEEGYLQDGFIMVEGDIALDKLSLEEAMLFEADRPALEGELDVRQNAVNPNLMVALNNTINIPFFIDDSVEDDVDNGGLWVDAIELAVDRWTDITQCRISFTEVNNPTTTGINFHSDEDLAALPACLENLPFNVIAAAQFPATGRPGRFISINVDDVVNNNNERISTAMHEIGHALGYRHADALGVEPVTGGGACGFNGLNRLDGTLFNDQNSVMTSGANFPTTFSSNDIKAARYAYPETYSTPSVYNHTVTSNTSTTRVVTLYANYSGTYPYHIVIERLAPWSSFPIDRQVFQNDLSPSIVSPTGIWNFRVVFENYGTLSLPSLPVQINVQ